MGQERRARSWCVCARQRCSGGVCESCAGESHRLEVCAEGCRPHTGRCSENCLTASSDDREKHARGRIHSHTSVLQVRAPRDTVVRWGSAPLRRANICNSRPPLALTSPRPRFQHASTRHGRSAHGTHLPRATDGGGRVGSAGVATWLLGTAACGGSRSSSSRHHRHADRRHASRTRPARQRPAHWPASPPSAGREKGAPHMLRTSPCTASPLASPFRVH